ncbi:RICIN domain-containing protein [Dactylosporangium sp. AC04546]|uniref:rhamnogalacturonan lyase family protein n=1 Tax=Dactylosporangium sp. AC04546 TaxID=2862460 RepID=UPI0027148265|nr:RICIN domain-containing protein [Dactylosporangium sp. AC04546]WVK81496.1 RICIN domain-containing protein [Dactylosporangium sp. AC04546]
MSRKRLRRWPVLAAALGVAVPATAAVVVVVMPTAEAATTPVAGGTYTVVPGASGKCVEVAAGSADNGALLQQAACASGATRQQWKVAGSSQYTLMNVSSTRCVDVPNSATTSGLQLQQWGCGDGTKTNQLWTFTASTAAAGKYLIKNVATGLCVSDKDGSTAGNNPIVQETCADVARMQFAFNLVGAAPTSSPPPATTGRQLEDLDRGLISVRSGNGNLLSWRSLGTEAADLGYNVYRAGTKLNATPITGSTNYLDSGAAAGAAYTVRAVVGGVEQADSPAALQFTTGYRDVRLQIPAGGTTPDGVAYTYSANDASVGDLDGDGVYEFVVKWDPSNSKDNSQSGYTGNVYVDAYKLDGTRLWRIDLGRNIRAGAHYTQFQVYDYDGDGRAEVAMKTADGTRSGTGQVIGSSTADYRNSSGYVLSGPEFLTMFDGLTGAALSTVNYVPARGTVSSWGDSYGNRVDRFLAGTAYLDGQRPSLVMARGYYTRAVVAAWDFRNGTLVNRWTYDSGTSNTGAYGQGNHQLSIADVDADGKDEIVYGSAAINDNGALLWRIGYGHGDTLHVGDFIPSRTGLEVYKPTEDGAHPTDFMADARTGAIIWSHPACSCDNGRGVAGDIYAGSPGAEAWSSSVSGLTSASGANIGRKPSSTNFLIWWDGDPVRELLDSTHIDKYGTSADTRLLTGSGVASNNTTKATPALSADLFGDWREEVVWRLSDSSALRIYSTPIQTDRRIPTLMHDAQYRVAVAWQNTAYNQPPHPSYFLGDGMGTPPRPAIYVR